MATPPSLDLPVIDFTDVEHILDLLPPLDEFYNATLPYAVTLRNGWTMRSNRRPLPPVDGVPKHTPDTWVLTTHIAPSAAAVLASMTTDLPRLQPRLDKLLDASNTEVISMGRILAFNEDLVTHLSIHYGTLPGTFVISLLTIPRIQMELDQLHRLIVAHVSDLM